MSILNRRSAPVPDDPDHIPTVEVNLAHRLLLRCSCGTIVALRTLSIDLVSIHEAYVDHLEAVDRQGIETAPLAQVLDELGHYVFDDHAAVLVKAIRRLGEVVLDRERREADVSRGT